jgi:hypothetical protein
MTILLLHDDPWDRERIASVLRTVGYAVIATDDIDYTIAIIEDADECVSLLIAPRYEYHGRLKARMYAIAVTSTRSSSTSVPSSPRASRSRSS